MHFKAIIVILVISFVSSGYGSNCPSGQPILKSGVTSQDQQTIVDVHNKFRLQIAQGQVPNQPKGTNLKRMVWDAQLSQEAQVVSNSCEMNHITINDPRFFWVGQNLYSSWSSSSSDTSPDWESAITSWFNEYKYFTYPNKSSGTTGHYTQVIWADTTNVGCDYAFFKDVSNNMYSKLYTCNYGPGGNMQGQAPYQTGTSGCENLC